MVQLHLPAEVLALPCLPAAAAWSSGEKQTQLFPNPCTNVLACGAFYPPALLLWRGKYKTLGLIPKNRGSRS